MEEIGRVVSALQAIILSFLYLLERPVINMVIKTSGKTKTFFHILERDKVEIWNSRVATWPLGII